MNEAMQPPQPVLDADGYPQHPPNFFLIMCLIAATIVLAGGLILSYLDRRNKVLDD